MTNFIRNTFTLDYPYSAKRIELYDYLRGVAMFLVLLQHAVVPGWDYLCVFHMPLFFFLSGYVTSNKELPKFSMYAKRRFLRLIIPYLVFGVFEVTLHTLIDSFYLHREYDFYFGILGVLTGLYEFGEGIGVYWFLMTMFIADLMVYPIVYYGHNFKIALMGGTILFLLFSYATTHLYPIPIYTIDKSFMAAAFILLGNFCQPVIHLLTKKRKFSLMDALLITSGLYIIWLSKEENEQIVLMYINQYGNYFWFLAGAIAGIIATILIGKYLYELTLNMRGFIHRLLLWIGFNSLVLFPIHIELKIYLGEIYQLLGISHWTLLLVSFLIVGIPASNFVTNYMPWALGKKVDR